MRIAVSVDRQFCIGSENCVRLAKGAFALDEEGVSVPVDPAAASLEQLRAAERSCPAQAISVLVEEDNGSKSKEPKALD